MGMQQRGQTKVEPGHPSPDFFCVQYAAVWKRLQTIATLRALFESTFHSDLDYGVHQEEPSGVFNSTESGLCGPTSLVQTTTKSYETTNVGRKPWRREIWLTQNHPNHCCHRKTESSLQLQVNPVKRSTKYTEVGNKCVLGFSCCKSPRIKSKRNRSASDTQAYTVKQFGCPTVRQSRMFSYFFESH